LAVQIGYARTKNNDLFNGFISKLEKTSAKELNAKEAKYLKETSRLFNFMMVDGSAGSGKSTGFSYFLSEVLKLDGKVVVAASQLEERAKNLAKTLGVQHVSTETILDTIIKSKDPKITKKTGIYTLDGDHVKLDDSKFEVTTELSESLKTIFGNDLSKVVLFVDEITLLHSGKLRVLSEFAEKVGMTIIALGDSKQEDALYKENPHSIEDFIFIKAPKLQASLRITNKAKKKNRLVVESVLNEIDEVYSLYPE
jgi:thymidine kinase